MYFVMPRSNLYLTVPSLHLQITGPPHPPPSLFSPDFVIAGARQQLQGLLIAAAFGDLLPSGVSGVTE
jgi:hypothetical protein